MATEVFIRRGLRGDLLPADEASKAAILEMPKDKVLKATVVMRRNYKRLKWWWKLCEIVSDNSEHYPSQKAVSDMLKLKCGHFETVIVQHKDGAFKPHYIPGSISFGSMDEAAFKTLCDKAVQVCASVLSVQSDELHDALNDFLSGRAAA